MLRDNLDYIHAHPEIYFTKEAKKGGYICPVCGNGSGEDGTGVKLIKGQSFRYKCFKCDTSGDVINFYAAEHHIDNREAILQVCALYGLEVPTKKFKKVSHIHRRISSNTESAKNKAETEIIANDIVLAASHLRETDYFSKRGISYETAEKYHCGYIEQWTHPTKRGANNIFPSPRVIIPTSTESYVARSTDDNKIPKMKAGAGNIFNIDILKSSRQNVVVVEGEFDALSIIEAGNDAIALGSTSNVDKLIDWLREKNIRTHLPLVLSLDADEVGQKATDKLADALRNMRIQFYSVNLIVEGCKDQNESLVKFRDSFFQIVADIPNKVNQLQQQARFKLTDFAKIDKWEKNIRTGRKAISTGWDSLDKALDSGLYEGLYVIPGTPGTGKTALALQMAFQIAQQQQDVLYISMEMGEEEIYERHISRISYQLFWHDEKNRHKAKTVHSMIQEGKTVAQAREIFKKVAPYLRTECSVGTIDADDIRNIVEIYKYELNSLPVVFIDYLQILKAHDAHMTDKQAVDYNVLRLKQLSRDFKIPVVILSSMNRMSYSDVISMVALKESGAIEYTADVCLGLQHANMEQIKIGTSAGKAEKTIRQMKGKSERDMEIVVLKNRNGKIGEELSFSYYAMFHHFKCLSEEIYESNNANNIFDDMETTNNHPNWV
ncbi:MAG: toprim domain-containing protein [Selenomonadaceae bacterium]|nr:toprim domain-containing protein [Selenomonadaceae bacterium]